MSQLGQSRPGRASSEPDHVRYALKAEATKIPMPRHDYQTGDRDRGLRARRGGRQREHRQARGFKRGAHVVGRMRVAQFLAQQDPAAVVSLGREGK